MKISKELRKAINAGVRRLCGANPLAEVGFRQMTARACGDRSGRTVGANALTWEPGADLFDVTRLADISAIDDDPDLPGAATLDLYVTSGIGSARELETNVYVTIKDGKLADIHRIDREADRRTLAILGRPFSPPDPLEVGADDWDGAKEEDAR